MDVEVFGMAASKARNFILRWGQIALGLVLCVLGYRLFLIPNDIAPGGFTGIGQLINALTGLPVGAVSIALNVPLFLFAFRMEGAPFAWRSLVATVGLSLMLDHLPIDLMTEDMLLAAVYGGLLSGAGFGLVLRGGATTGGSDMLGKLIGRKFSWIPVGTLILMIDGLVVVGSGVVFELQNAMYAMIAAFIMSKVLDTVLVGFNTANAYFVVSKNSAEIARRVLQEMERGVTGLNGQGMYSGEDKQVLLCVVSRAETKQLKDIVTECDPDAFLIATSVHEALGQGFTLNSK